MRIDKCYECRKFSFTSCFVHKYDQNAVGKCYKDGTLGESRRGSQIACENFSPVKTPNRCPSCGCERLVYTDYFTPEQKWEGASEGLKCSSCGLQVEDPVW